MDLVVAGEGSRWSDLSSVSDKGEDPHNFHFHKPTLGALSITPLGELVWNWVFDSVTYFLLKQEVRVMSSRSA